MIILAVETSCDETSVAIMEDKRVLCNVISSQVALHQKYGGVVPEIAARAHSDNIYYVLSQALSEAKISLDAIDYVAYTVNPGLVSCLYVGKVVAQTIACYLNKPLVPCHHLTSHLYASLIEHQWAFPVLGLIVSGGHTQIVLLTEHLHSQVIGETVDDAVGECYDKVARMLGLNYPGGPEIAKLAIKGKDRYLLPWPKKDASCDFSFSGLKSACAKIIKAENNQINVADFSCSLQTTITGILLYKLKIAITKYQPKTVVLAGGVSANEHLRTNFLALNESFSQIQFLVPSQEYCTDNAAMVAMLAFYQLQR